MRLRSSALFLVLVSSMAAFAQSYPASAVSPATDASSVSPSGSLQGFSHGAVSSDASDSSASARLGAWDSAAGRLGYLPTSIEPRLPRKASAMAGDGSRTPSRLPRCPAPCANVTFDGLSNDQMVTPADPTGAGGTTHVVAAVNMNMAVYDKSGNLELGPLPLKKLMGGQPPILTDPKVVYDQYADTYVLIWLGLDFNSGTSRVMSVTIPDATAATKSSWCISSWNADQLAGDGKQLGDYPTLGYDQNRVTITTNQFTYAPGFPYRGSQIVSFDKTSFYGCSPAPIADIFTTDATKLPGGGRPGTLQAAQSVGVAPNGFLLGTVVECTQRTCVSKQLALYRVSGTPGAAALSKTLIDSRTSHIIFGGQAGAPASSWDSYWDVGDLRLTNAFFDGATGKVYGAHAVKKNLGSRSYIEAVSRFYEVGVADPISGSTLDRVGDVGAADVDTGWPAVATDIAGNLHVNLSRASGASGAKEFIGAWAAIVPPGVTTVSTMIRFGEGRSVYDVLRGPERWGDYNAINRDSVDGTQVWYFNQYVLNKTNWRQAIAEMVDL